MLPVVVGIITPLLGDASHETFLMSFLNLFILAHYRLYLISIFALFLPYVVLITIILLRIFYFPPKREITQDNSDEYIKENVLHHRKTNMSSRKLSTRSVEEPIDVHITGLRILEEVSIGIGSFIYNFLYILVRPKALVINIRRRFESLKQQKWRRWNTMNMPQKFHGIKSEDIDFHRGDVYSLYHHDWKSEKTLDIPEFIWVMSTSQDLQTSWKTVDGPKDGYISTITKKVLLNDQANVPLHRSSMSAEEPVFNKLQIDTEPNQQYNLFSKRFRDKAQSHNRNT